MRYYIKQKVFSWRDRFKVNDESGRDAYYVEGELFSLGKKLSITNYEGQEVLHIEQNVWNFLPNYTLYMYGEEVATVRKEFSFFKPRYSILGPNWEVEGNIWAHNYDIYEGNDLIASINKEWFTWGDSYELNIIDESHSLMALGVIIIIDCVLAAQQNSNNNG